MFDFDFEEFKADLANMTYEERYNAYEEKLDELEVLREEIEDAIRDICDIREDDMNSHDKEVWQDASQAVKQHFNADAKVAIDDEKQIFKLTLQNDQIFVRIAPLDAEIGWYIAVAPEFIADNAKRKKALTEIAAILDLPCDDDYEVSVDVPEAKLIPTLINTITKLCK